MILPVKTLGDVRVDFETSLLRQFMDAWQIADNNGWVPVRFVLSRRLRRRLGGPLLQKIYSIPVTFDDETEEGFGLVVRPR